MPYGHYMFEIGLLNLYNINLFVCLPEIAKWT